MQGTDSSGMPGTLLTEAVFRVGDVPEDYLKPSDHPGRVEKVRYTTVKEEEIAGIGLPGDSGDSRQLGSEQAQDAEGIQGNNNEQETQVKSALVYLPEGYDESDQSYNVLYILHASGGSPKNYLNEKEATEFQNILDHMIAAGEIEPLIVVAPTYYSPDSFVKFLPLAVQVMDVSDFSEEMTEAIIPAVESTYRTYAESADAQDLIASRDHRAIAGFSLGGTAAWYAFIQKMDYFCWFLPISEASWDDGNGGIFGIRDSDISAKVLYDAVGEQGYTADDFYLFVATGTEDVAFEVATEQMKSLLEYDDIFITGQNTSCSMMIGGTHSLSAINTYMYHIFPALF